LNRAKESHQSTNRAPLSNSPAVSLFKTALSPTSCASAADILCYADCTLCSLDKPNTPYLTSFPQRYCCLQIAICLPRAYVGFIALLDLALLLPVFLRSLASAAAPSASLCFGSLEFQLSAASAIGYQFSGMRTTSRLQRISTACLSASPKSNRPDMSLGFKQGFPWCL
jgi:hypothetical protein